MKLGGSALSSRFSAIKFLHLVEGRGDFEGKTYRIHALINAVKRKNETKQQPVNPEMLRWGKARMSSLEGAKWKAVELWSAILMGFHFALRISEIEALEDRDVSFQEDKGVRFVTIMIRGSKTDQQLTVKPIRCIPEARRNKVT